jgi:hypothetical protein
MLQKYGPLLYHTLLKMCPEKSEYGNKVPNKKFYNPEFIHLKLLEPDHSHLNRASVQYQEYFLTVLAQRKGLFRSRKRNAKGTTTQLSPTNQDLI